MQPKTSELNVVLEKELLDMIEKISKKKGISRSLFARDLIKEALELYEDLYWNEIAEERDKKFSQKVAIAHDEVWD